jgi:threonine dehydrogenase-like Zn-dependent dehydrogenase
MNTKSVSITHLVFGLIFLGVTALWVVGATTGLEAPALAVWGPVVLIGAGLVGLAATVFNARNARASGVPVEDNDTQDNKAQFAESGVTEEEQS